MFTNFFQYRETRSQQYFIVLAAEGFTRHNDTQGHRKDCAGESSLSRQYFIMSAQVFGHWRCERSEFFVFWCKWLFGFLPFFFLFWEALSRENLCIVLCLGLGMTQEMSVKSRFYAHNLNSTVTLLYVMHWYHGRKNEVYLKHRRSCE